MNALCKSTHTLDQRYTTPRVTENDAPNIRVYVCVVCVGVYWSIKNIVLGRTKTYSFPNESIVVGQAKEHFFPSETQRDLGETPYEKTGVPHQYT